LGTRIDAVGVVVRDMPRALAFYRRLGCEFAPDAETEGHVECLLGGVRLMFDTVELMQAAGLADHVETAPRNGVALAANCETPAAVDELYADLDADGLGRTPPWDAVWGMRYAIVADPEGMQVDLYAPLPG
jgi:uncharacterized glyoxalase superfamily protein PhnB